MSVIEKQYYCIVIVFLVVTLIISTFRTCGLWVNVGEVLVALQFDFIKNVHLLLCRERTIKLHLWSTTNKVRSLAQCVNQAFPLALKNIWDNLPFIIWAFVANKWRKVVKTRNQTEEIEKHIVANVGVLFWHKYGTRILSNLGLLFYMLWHFSSNRICHLVGCQWLFKMLIAHNQMP